MYVNVEAAQAAREDVERAMRVILGALGDAALLLGDAFLDETWTDVLARFGDGALGAALTRWCKADPRPLVLLIDEIRHADRRYADSRCCVSVVFDRREGRSWEEKVFRREERVGARTVTVWGM